MAAPPEHRAAPLTLAGGARGVVLPASRRGGFELALRTDISMTWTSLEAAPDSGGAERAADPLHGRGALGGEIWRAGSPAPPPR